MKGSPTLTVVKSLRLLFAIQNESHAYDNDKRKQRYVPQRYVQNNAMKRLQFNVMLYDCENCNQNANPLVISSGGSRKTTQRQSKKRPAERITSDNVSPLATEESSASPSNNHTILTQPTASALPCTPKRTSRRTQMTQEAYLTSTPLKNTLTGNLSDISKSPPRSKHVKPEHTKQKVLDRIFMDKYLF